MSKNRLNIKYIFRDFIDNIWSVYFYLLGFYVVSIILSYFFNGWSEYFYWPAFHGAVIILTFFACLKIGVFTFLLKVSKNPLDFKLTFQNYLKNLWNLLHKEYLQFRQNKIFILKLFFIINFMLYASMKGTAIIDFWILFFTLASILFNFGSEISASITVSLLVFCALLLMFQKEILAEKIAIYAYFFLVIMILTKIRKLAAHNKKYSVDNLVASKKNRVIMKVRG